MKIGVCLSGHYRNFDYNYDSWNQLLFSKYDCDVFLHTWDVVGNRKTGWQNDTNFSESLDKLKYTQDELKTKYGFKEMPSAKSVGDKGSDIYAYEIATTIAEALSSCGINLNFAPVADLHNPLCPVLGKINRCFSADPEKVSHYDSIYIQAHH